MLYHLDYRPTWMESVEIFTAPAPVERLAGGALPSQQGLRGDAASDSMKGEPPAMQHNRNLVREGARF